MWEKLYSLGIRGQFLSCLKALYSDDCVDCLVNGLLTRPIFLRRGLRQGCSLSPILFALYISDVGNDITNSDVGFSLGNVTVSGLLFADDVLIMSRSADGLKSLLSIVKKGFDRLMLVISHEKSQIISPDEIHWDLFDPSANAELSLKQVALYKYLGIWTYNTMHKTSVEKQKLCVKTAFKYKGTCIHVSNMGPDIVDVVECTWLNVAIPAVLNGCEVIPFSETHIIEIDRIQSQVAKFALGLPSSSPNFCAQSELGWKTFRQKLYERQLKFYSRVLYQNERRWSHQALMEHLSGTWPSLYLDYICSIRSRLSIFAAPTEPKVWKGLSYQYFLDSTNLHLSSISWLKPLESFSRKSYVCESKWSSVISSFRLASEGLGNKQPRMGYTRKPFCPICPDLSKNCGQHLLFSCSSLSALRVETGISAFMNSCSVLGYSFDEAYSLFINGLNSVKKPVSKIDFFDRAKCMHDMKELWLSKW